MNLTLAKLPTLKASLELSAPGHGLCFHRSAAMVFDLPGAHMLVGTFRAATEEEARYVRDASPVPFIHAWVWYKGAAISPTLLEQHGLRPMHVADYLRVNDARDVQTVTRPLLLELDRQYGLKRHLTRYEPLRGGARFATTLLDAIGFHYRVSPEGGVLPA